MKGYGVVSVPDQHLCPPSSNVVYSNEDVLPKFETNKKNGISFRFIVLIHVFHISTIQRIVVLGPVYNLKPFFLITILNLITFCQKVVTVKLGE